MQPTHVKVPALIKEAAGNNMLKVGPRADRWVQEVMQRLREEHPYVSEYSLRGALTHSDQEKQYGMGYVDVRSHSDSPLKMPGIRIPFVIEKGMLHPIKVFLDPKGRADHLEKDIVGEVLFSAAPSLSLTQPEPTTSLMSALYPPDRVRHGMMGMGGSQFVKQNSAMVDPTVEILDTRRGPWLGDDAERMLKEAGVSLGRAEREQIHKKAQARLHERGQRISLLDKVAHTFDRSQLDHFANQITQDVATRFHHNHKIGMVNYILQVKPCDESAASQALKLASRTDFEPEQGGMGVMQIERMGAGKYLIKRASTETYEPSRDLVSVHDIGAVVGEDFVADVRENGRATISTEAAIQQNLDDTLIEHITDYGIFKVQSLEDGAHLLGWAITNVLDFYGGASNLKIFTNGEKYALQEHMAGVRVSQGTALPRKVPKGGDFGSFYSVSPSGRVSALLPVTITHEEDIEGSKYWACVDLWGTPIRITLAPDMKRPVETEEHTFALPDTMLFLPLKREVKLVPEPLLFSKTARANNVRLIYNGMFSFQGPAVEKVSHAHRSALSEADAEMLGVALGLDVDTCRNKLAWAMKEGETTFLGRTLVSGAAKREKIASIQAHLRDGKGDAARQVARGLYRDTVKIAAMLPDMATPNSVDAVLSLNFINQENLQLFIESLPHLETARRDLAELYITTMVGLPDVSNTAILRAMENLTEVCKGLRKVKMRATLV